MANSPLSFSKAYQRSKIDASLRHLRFSKMFLPIEFQMTSKSAINLCRVLRIERSGEEIQFSHSRLLKIRSYIYRLHDQASNFSFPHIGDIAVLRPIKLFSILFKSNIVPTKLRLVSFNSMIKQPWKTISYMIYIIL